MNSQLLGMCPLIRLKKANNDLIIGTACCSRMKVEFFEFTGSLTRWLSLLWLRNATEKEIIVIWQCPCADVLGTCIILFDKHQGRASMKELNTWSNVVKTYSFYSHDARHRFDKCFLLVFSHNLLWVSLLIEASLNERKKNTRAIR